MPTNLYVIATTTIKANTLNVPPATALNGAVQSLPNMDAINSPYPGIGKFAINKNTEPQIVNGVVIIKPSRNATTARICANLLITSIKLSKSFCLSI